MPPHPPLHYSGKKWWTVALQDTPGPGPDTTHIARQCSSIKTTPVVRIANMSESSGNVPLSRHHPDFDRVKDTITCSEFRDTLWGFVLAERQHIHFETISMMGSEESTSKALRKLGV
ncbi:hypothetical protein CHU98_g226 [Xylaria longipes]|nr:hypothetical protein CHU98_g226 [Xylaria longipes]